ncbi:hypothetical protein BGAL_0044g00240 [Botrytis galanthina]|uniref:Uncharacterized protein n=1 Tax=Botrytis galanthina TaxID=278940 RepID=A0A4S8RGI1_9HELO|nr:hypothetical protein BGAL_0044g00240 [Botrytis galanthina]
MHRVKRVFTLCSSACSANGGVGIWNGEMGKGGDQMSQDLKNEERARGAREGVNKMGLQECEEEETDTFWKKEKKYSNGRDELRFGIDSTNARRIEKEAE